MSRPAPSERQTAAPAAAAAGSAAHIALLQVRDEPRAEAQERRCFAAACGRRPDEIVATNLAVEPRLRWRDVAAADVLIVGGAGSHTVTRRYRFSEPLAEVVLRWLDEGRPFFGSCWGHHLLVQLAGGSVVTDPAAEEIGTFAVELTAAGRADPLFAGMPPGFDAQLGHHDRVDRPPPGVVELAATRRCRFQALRLGDRPVYGTQFHPELSREAMLERLEIYRDAYLDERETIAALGRRLRPTPEASSLLARFLALYA